MSIFSLDSSKHHKSDSCLPLIDRNLNKNRKYYYKNCKENVLKQDINSLIFHIVNRNIPTCRDKLEADQRKFIINKIELSQIKNAVKIQYLPQTTEHMDQLKNIKQQIRKYIQVGSERRPPISNDYREFVRLSQQSQDYLEYYLKNQFKTYDSFKELRRNDRTIILSMLKNNYKALTENPPSIANRILLSLSLNPINDFHFVDWQTFSKFRKLATGSQTKSQGKAYLLHYFFVNKTNLTKSQFLAIMAAIVRKLQVAMNKNNVERLTERVQSYIGKYVKESMGKTDLQGLMNAQPMFVWTQLLQLIFMV